MVPVVMIAPWFGARGPKLRVFGTAFAHIFWTLWKGVRMHQHNGSPDQPPTATRDFYLHSIDLLNQAHVPYVVGGGYAMAHYTGIIRHTKDLDVFVRPDHRDRALKVFADAGYRTEITWPHFLAKALHGDAFVDVIYNSGNGLCPVDDDWFTRAEMGKMLGQNAPMCPPEEMIWSKAFVQDRDRYDGADVAHIILARGDKLDWHRVIKRFRNHERVLLAHLILFGYSYPSLRDKAPGWVMEELLVKVRAELPVQDPICMGTNLAIRQYLTDVSEWGFEDARLQPRGPLTADEISRLPAA